MNSFFFVSIFDELYNVLVSFLPHLFQLSYAQSPIQNGEIIITAQRAYREREMEKGTPMEETL